jgi:autotransporter-associated beta strand protein
LGAGTNQTLRVHFTPTDTTDFVGASASVTINVTALMVTNANDSGAGSLRQALLDAGNSPGTTHTIYFQLPTGPQMIDPATPLPVVSDPIIAVLDATQNVTVNSPASGGTNSFPALTKSGAGLLALSGANSLNGNMHVGNGRLRLAASTPTGLALGIAVNVDGTATLELAGSATNLAGGSHPVNISNSSSAAAGVEISGTHQVVGNITGAGSTTIDAGSNLTANSIVQGALVIGGSAGSPAKLTIAPSDSSGNPLVVDASFAQSQSALAAPLVVASSTADAASSFTTTIAATSDIAVVETPPSAGRATLPQNHTASRNPQIFDLRMFSLGLVQSQVIWSERKAVLDSSASSLKIADSQPAATTATSDSGGNPSRLDGDPRRAALDAAAVDAVFSTVSTPAINDGLAGLLAEDISDYRGESVSLDSGGDLAASPEPIHNLLASAERVAHGG